MTFQELLSICIHRYSYVLYNKSSILCVQINIRGPFSSNSLSRLGRIKRYAPQSPTGYILLASLLKLFLLDINIHFFLISERGNNVLILGMLTHHPSPPAAFTLSLKCCILLNLLLKKTPNTLNWNYERFIMESYSKEKCVPTFPLLLLQ